MPSTIWAALAALVLTTIPSLAVDFDQWSFWPIHCISVCSFAESVLFTPSPIETNPEAEWSRQAGSEEAQHDLVNIAQPIPDSDRLISGV
jgi:hypothetical protein